MEYLLKSNVGSILPETLSARVESILSDEPMAVTTYPTSAKAKEEKGKDLNANLKSKALTHQFLDPGPYFLGWLYHILSCPISPRCES